MFRLASVLCVLALWLLAAMPTQAQTFSSRVITTDTTNVVTAPVVQQVVMPAFAGYAATGGCGVGANFAPAFTPFAVGGYGGGLGVNVFAGNRGFGRGFGFRGVGVGVSPFVGGFGGGFGGVNVFAGNRFGGFGGRRFR